MVRESSSSRERHRHTSVICPLCRRSFSSGSTAGSDLAAVQGIGLPNTVLLRINTWRLGHREAPPGNPSGATSVVTPRQMLSLLAPAQYGYATPANMA